MNCQARRGEPEAGQALAKLVRDKESPDIARATALAEIGRRWFEGDAIEPAVLAAAAEELARLEDAVVNYVSDMEGGSGG